MNIVISFNPYRETDAAQALATQLRSADPDAVVVLSAQPDRYWGSDDEFPVSDWQEEAANDYTRQGYWEWVETQRETRADEDALEPVSDGIAPGARVTLPQAQPHKPVGTVLIVSERGVQVRWEALLGPPSELWHQPDELRVI